MIKINFELKPTPKTQKWGFPLTQIYNNDSQGKNPIEF